MTEESRESITTWPLAKFYFEVKISSEKNPAFFEEIIGLETESQVIEYRDGQSSSFSAIEMPEPSRVGKITLKSGIFVDDSEFHEWYTRIKMNSEKRANMEVSLLDDGGNKAMSWTISNALVTKTEGLELLSDSNLAIKSVEIEHDGITVLTD